MDNTVTEVCEGCMGNSVKAVHYLHYCEALYGRDGLLMKDV